MSILSLSPSRILMGLDLLRVLSKPERHRIQQVCMNLHGSIRTTCDYEKRKSFSESRILTRFDAFLVKLSKQKHRKDWSNIVSLHVIRATAVLI